MAEIDAGRELVAAIERKAVLRADVESEVRRVGLLVALQVEASDARRTCIDIARQATDDARIGRVELAQLAMHQADAAIQREATEHQIGVSLDTVNLRRAGHVQLEAEGRNGW